MNFKKTAVGVGSSLAAHWAEVAGEEKEDHLPNSNLE